MRVYNAKKAQIDFPLAGDTRVTVPGFSVSRDLLPNEQFLTMICQSFEPDEIALIVSGPFEVGLCGKNPTVTPFIVNSLDEAIKRYSDGKHEEELSTLKKIHEQVSAKSYNPETIGPDICNFVEMSKLFE
jgi:hypothetical protein